MPRLAAAECLVHQRQLEGRAPERITLAEKGPCLGSLSGEENFPERFLPTDPQHTEQLRQRLTQMQGNQNGKTSYMSPEEDLFPRSNLGRSKES